MSERFIHPTSIIGYSAMTARTDEASVIFEGKVTVGPYAVIGIGCRFGNNVFLDVGVRVMDDCVVGENTRIINDARINDGAVIGRDCIISGTVTDRTIVEDNVRHFGRIVHRHNNPRADWLTTDEPSAVLRQGCFIGSGSIVVGDIEIGRNVYIAAGEVVRKSVPEEHVLYKGRLTPIIDWAGSLSVDSQTQLL